ncbi:uncharacterized protein LOC144435027 [Glandiceps talaboti]
MSKKIMTCGDDDIGENQTCCNGELFVTNGTPANGGKCCGFEDGAVGYNPQYRMCCQGHLYELTSTQQQCSQVNTIFYVSNMRGNDKGNCSLSLPCKTIQRAVDIAKPNDVITIDATNNHLYPYKLCTEDTTDTDQHYGVYIEKSLHINTVNGTAIINSLYDCSVFYFNGTQNTILNREPIEVSLTNLTIISGVSPNPNFGAAITSKDASLIIDNCHFENLISRRMAEGKRKFAILYELETAIGNSPFLFLMFNTYLLNSTGSVGIIVEQQQMSMDTLDVVIKNCSFENNKLSGIYLKVSNIGNFTGHIQDSNFTEHTENNKGGVLYLEESLDEKTHALCDLTEDIIKALDASVLNVTSSGYHPRNCVDRETWRQYWLCKKHLPAQNYSMHLSFSNVYFNDNSATSAGGAIFADMTSQSHLVINKVNFYGNEATGVTGRGGALYLSGGTVEVRNTNFVDNSAFFLGGCIYLNTDGDAVYMDNCVVSITHTNTRLLGALLWSDYEGNLTIKNTRFEADAKNTDKVNAIWHGSPKPFKLDDTTSVICDKGYNLNLTQKYNRKQYDVFFTCQACGPETYSLGASYSNGSDITNITCHHCPKGANCAATSLKSKANHWGYEEDDRVNFLLCPPGYCCHGNTDSICDDFQSCHDGRIGALCGNCQSGYTESITTICVANDKCEESDIIYWILVIVIIIFIIVFSLMLSGAFRKNKDAVTEYTNCDINTSNQHAHEELDIVVHDNGGTKLRPTKQSKGQIIILIDILKLVFFFYQIVALLARPRSSKDSIFIVPGLYFIVHLFSFQVLPDFLETCLPTLDNYITKTLFINLNVIIPVVGILLLFSVIVYIFRCIKRRRNTSQIAIDQSISDHLTFALSMCIVFGYICTLNIVFSFTNWVWISGELRLYYSGELDLVGPWFILSLCVLGMTAFPFLFMPLLVLRKSQKGRFSYLYFAVLCILPLPILVYEGCCAIYNYRKKNGKNSVSKSYVTTNGVVTFLRGNYREKLAWYWESVMLTRRFVLVACHFYIKDEFQRTIILVVLCLIILFHHVYTKPYKSDSVNNVETGILLILITVGLVNTIDAFCYTYGSQTCKPGQHVLNVLGIFESVITLLPLVVFFLTLLCFLLASIENTCFWKECCCGFAQTIIDKIWKDVDGNAPKEDQQRMLCCDEETADGTTNHNSTSSNQADSNLGNGAPKHSATRSISTPRTYRRQRYSRLPTEHLEVAAVCETNDDELNDLGTDSMPNDPVLLSASTEDPIVTTNSVTESPKPNQGNGSSQEVGEGAAANSKGKELIPEMRGDNNVYLKACLEQLTRIVNTADDPAILYTTNFTTTVFAAGVFNYEGGHLTIEQAGVNLFIPPGALPEDDEPRRFYIYVSTNDSDYPRLGADQTALSPVIRCGPTNFTFQKHILLSVKNCIDSKQSGSLKLWRSLSDVDQVTNWHDSSEGQHTLCICQGQDSISFIRELAMFCVISNTDYCMYKVTIFISLVNDRFTKVRVLLSRDTPADTELMKVKEQGTDSYQYREEMKVNLNKSDGDYKIELKEIKPIGWTLVDGENSKMVSKESLWMNNQGGGPCPAVTFLLERGYNQRSQAIGGVINLLKSGDKKPLCSLTFDDDLALA